MTEHVIIKSFPSGIRVQLAKEPSFAQILQETEQSFAESAAFFKNASVALQFQGRELTQEETDLLYHAITKVCDLHIICIVCTDAAGSDYFKKLIEGAAGMAGASPASSDETECRFCKGNLGDGEIFESEGNAMILGEVQRGGGVIAKGNIIVLGGLYGTAYAGADGKTGRFIAALAMDAENLRIADCRYRRDIKAVLASRKNKQPKIATVKNNRIVMDELRFTNELLENNLI